jgi:alanyl-tRNA synthetase
MWRWCRRWWQDGRAFPELVRAEALITETLKLEETRFKRRWTAACAC